MLGSEKRWFDSGLVFGFVFVSVCLVGWFFCDFRGSGRAFLVRGDDSERCRLLTVLPNMLMF